MSIIEKYEKLAGEIITQLDAWTHSYENGLPTYEPEFSKLKLQLMKFLEESLKEELP